MRKPQVIKFWKDLQSSTSVKETLSRFADKPGFDGRRTLERYVQAYQGFEAGSTLAEVTGKTGWSLKTVQQLQGWWEESFSSQAGKYLATIDKLDKHRDDLLNAVIPEFRKLEAFSLSESESKRLVSWWMDNNRPKQFLLPWGEMEAECDSSTHDIIIGLRLYLEEKPEWKYLRQHFPEDPLAKMVKDCKQALNNDLQARLYLIEHVKARFWSETRLNCVFEFENPDDNGVRWEMVYLLYASFLSQVVDIPRPNIEKYLRDYTGAGNNWVPNWQIVIRAQDSKQHDGVIQFSLKSQKQNPSFEAQTVQKAYWEAQQKTRQLRDHAEEIRLALDFPEGSSCDVCRSVISRQKENL